MSAGQDDRNNPKLTERTVTAAPVDPPPPDTPGGAPGAGGETGTLFQNDAGTRSELHSQPPAPPGYEILSEVGRGGMGVVYKAMQRNLNRIVALKVVLAGGHASVSQRMRFLAEAEAVASLSHPGIVGVYDFGTWDGQPYMALEFCPGGTLGEKLNGTPLAHREASILLERMARAVSTAHARGIVHRDIKPANILLAADGNPKVVDFGLAKITESREGLTITGAVMGTPSYMAPEQAKGETKKVGPTADVYALGAVLYECLTGRPPFKGSNSADTIMQSLNTEPVGVRALNPLVPVDLETVCLKCLEKDPTRRYATAAELADDLTRFLGGLPVIARPVGPLGRARRWISRNQVVTGLLVAIVLAIAAGTTATYVKYRDEAVQRAKAEAETAAKEHALSELRKTLAALEELSAEQTHTLSRLTIEKAATEDALLLGLLRPLRDQVNAWISLEETRALFELAALPEERLRFRFVERGLLSADGADKLAAWPNEVVCAVVGLDRAAAVRLQALVASVMNSKMSSIPAREACAFLAAALPHDPEFDRAAADILLRRIVQERDSATVSDLSAGLTALLPRLTSVEVAQIAQALAARIAVETDLSMLNGLASAIAPLGERLDPPGAMAVAQILTRRLTAERDVTSLTMLPTALSALALRLRPVDSASLAGALSRRLSERLASDKDSAQLPTLATVLLIFSSRLTLAESAALVGQPARALAARIAAEKEWTSLSTNCNNALFNLTTVLTPADAAAVLQRFMDRLENDTSILPNLYNTLSTVAMRLAPVDVLPLLKTLANRITPVTDPTTLSQLSYILTLVAGGVGTVGPGLSQPTGLRAGLMGADVDAILGPVARTIAARLVKEKDANVIATLGNSLTNLNTMLGPKDSFAVAKILMSWAAMEKDAISLSYFNAAIVPLAPRIAAADAAPLARSLASRLATEKDAIILNYLCPAFSELSARVRPVDLSAIVFPIARMIADRLATEKDNAALSNLSAALSTLAPRLHAAEAAALGGVLATRIKTDPDALTTMYLAQTLPALAERLDENAALKMLAPAIELIIARSLTEKDQFALGYLTTSITSIAYRITPSDAGSFARVLAGRIVMEKETGLQSYYGTALIVLSPRLTDEDFRAVVHILAGRIPTEKDTAALSSLNNTLAGLNPRLSQVDAAAIVEVLAVRMTTEKDTNNLARFDDVFTSMISRVSDAQLLAVLKANLIFPPIRNPILAEFSSRANLTPTTAAMALAGVGAVQTSPSSGFRDVWEFMNWAEKSRPDLDLRPVPRLPGGN
jgi:Protein kinase domain